MDMKYNPESDCNKYCIVVWCQVNVGKLNNYHKFRDETFKDIKISVVP
jgi:hypothetical protein